MSEPWTEASEKEALKRCEVATKPPWTLTRDGGIIQTNHITRDVWTIPHCDGDIPFIAHARTDLPDCIAECRRLRGELIDLKAECEEMNAESTVFRCVLRNISRCDPLGEHTDAATVADCDKVYDYAAYRQAASDVIGAQP